MRALLTATWQVLLELAPWLLLGAAVAGALHILLPPDFLARHLRGRWGVARAVLFGVPLPLCSCGVIPAGLSLKQDGASDGAAVGFLIATPQTGVDSLVVSAGFLGWPFALFKLGSAALTGLIGGWLTDRFGGAAGEPAPPSCATPPPRTLRALLAHGLDLIRSIWGWLVFGVLASAALTAFVPPEALSGLGAWGVLGVLAVSVPLYVCATASVPIAAALVAGGMPTGAALIFLMAGPATNVATIGAIYRGFGGRTLGIYLGTVILGSAALGTLFDFVIPVGTHAHAHAHGEAWWAVASAAALLGLFAWFGLEQLGAAWRRRLSRARPALSLPIAGMRCGRCVRKVEEALGAVPGVEAVTVERDPDRALVRGTAPEAALRAALVAAGYQPG